MGSSDCEICGENDYLKEYSLDELPKNIYVCRNCVEEGIRLRIKQFEEAFVIGGLN
jgi:hypothetical protein